MSHAVYGIIQCTERPMQSLTDDTVCSYLDRLSISPPEMI